MLPKTWHLENGSFAATATAVFGLATLVISVIMFTGQLALAKQQTQLIADSAALIASETQRGLIAGFACEKAEEYVKTFDIFLDSCRIVSSEASVELAVWVGVFSIDAKATAGPS